MKKEEQPLQQFAFGRWTWGHLHFACRSNKNPLPSFQEVQCPRKSPCDNNLSSFDHQVTIGWRAFGSRVIYIIRVDSQIWPLFDLLSYLRVSECGRPQYLQCHLCPLEPWKTTKEGKHSNRKFASPSSVLASGASWEISKHFKKRTNRIGWRPPDLGGLSRSISGKSLRLHDKSYQSYWRRQVYDQPVMARYRQIVS